MKFPRIVCNGYNYKIEADGVYLPGFKTLFYWRANMRLQQLIRNQIRATNSVQSMANEYLPI